MLVIQFQSFFFYKFISSVPVGFEQLNFVESGLGLKIHSFLYYHYALVKFVHGGYENVHAHDSKENVFDNEQ